MAVVRIITGDMQTAVEEVCKQYVAEFESYGSSKQHSVALAKQLREAVRSDFTSPGRMVNRGIPNATGQETGYR